MDRFFLHFLGDWCELLNRLTETIWVLCINRRHVKIRDASEVSEVEQLFLYGSSLEFYWCSIDFFCHMVTSYWLLSNDIHGLLLTWATALAESVVQFDYFINFSFTGWTGTWLRKSVADGFLPSTSEVLLADSLDWLFLHPIDADK